MGEVPAINHAFAIAQQSRLSAEELETFKKQQMFINDNRNALLKAEQDVRLDIARKSYAPPEAIAPGCSRSGEHCTADWFGDQ
jgi:hypothetical protein